MRRISLAIISGLLYALAFPAYDLWPLAWIFAVPLFFLMEDAGPAEIFYYGFVAGLVAWAGILYWIAYVMDTYGGMSLLPASFLLLVLLFYLAVYFGVFAYLASRLKNSRYGFLTIPGLWIVLELIRSYVMFQGFPWALVGYSQFAWKPLIQIAEFGGVYLISGIIIMVNFSLYTALRKQYLPVLSSMCVLAACVVWGSWRMETFPAEGEPLKAAVAQANIPQEKKWLQEMIDPTIEIYSRLTSEALDQGAELVVWPETACSFYLFRQWPQTSKVLDLSQNSDAKLLIGSPAFDDGRYFNRMWLLHEGSIEGIYDKVHLVPFGEYLPLSGLIEPIFGNLTQAVGSFSSAEKLSPIGEIGVLICFESVFPAMTRDLCRKGAAYLVNASNDAWFKTWATPSQHLQMACFRAVESRRWMLRSVNHGISAIVSPAGEIIAEIPLLEEGVILAEITRSDYMTFYARFGPVLAWLWAGVFIIAALTSYKSGANA